MLSISVLMAYFASSVPIFDAQSPIDQQDLSNCTKDEDIRCFYKWVDPTHRGAFNTKKQRRPYQRFCKQSCGRARKLSPIYIYADQTSEDCKHALSIEFK